MERNCWINRRQSWIIPILACLLLLALVLPGCWNNSPPVSTVDANQQIDKAPEDLAPETKPSATDPATVEEPSTPLESETDPEMDKDFPYRFQLDFPDFPVGHEWINSQPLSKADLKGKFVLLDFWTYCCINCIHILPELKKLEREYANELVVIGVHCAKFEAEQDSENIKNAVLRYEIEHPVINDPNHEIWNALGVSSWPTLLLLDPEGNVVWGDTGEFEAKDVSAQIARGMAYYKAKGTLSEKPLKFDLEQHKVADTPLRFPGKVLADGTGKRLFISDSNHNRIVVTDLEGKVQSIIGSGKIGREDGDFAAAAFDHPQGMALTADGKTLYVADTENHLLRKVDLEAQSVKTIAGTGAQARGPWPGLEGVTAFSNIPDRFVGPPATTGINSPWDLWIHDGSLYIAMAGPHQIWKMPLDESEIGPFAGNGREDIVDGPHLPSTPYALGASSFAQPSGLSSDGKVLFVADSEGSSIRAVPFDTEQEVTTVVGSAHLPGGRLFDFGDVDGPPETAKLQHALGVTYVDGKLYVTDTYNNKIKVVDATTGDTKTLAGDTERGNTDDPPRFNEPAGISHANGILYIADTNNQLIRTLDLQTGKVGTLTITGLPNAAPEVTIQPAGFNEEVRSEAKNTAQSPVAQPGTESSKAVGADVAKANEKQLPLTSVKPADGKVTLHVHLVLPTGWKINPIAPMSYVLESTQQTGPIDRTSFGKHKLDKPAAEFDVPLTIKGDGDDTVSVGLRYYYCEDVEGGEGNCKINSINFNVPLKISTEGKTATVELKHEVEQ